MKNQPLLSVTQAAAALGLSRARVLVLIGTGRLPAAKVGQQWTIRPADLEAVRDRPNGRPRKEN